MSKIVELVNVFALLSLLAVGGGTAVLPEMQHVTVERRHWVSDTQFAEIYSLGQLAPGPNMTCVALIGYEVGQRFDGTVIPLTLGFVGCGLAALLIVTITERGRLFQPAQDGMTNP